MHRAILLQTEVTSRKLRMLKGFAREAADCSNWMLSERLPKESATHLQARLLGEAKERFGFNVQVICDLARGLAKSKGTKVDGTTVKFNIPRNCNTFRTKEFFFVDLGLYPRRRLAVPIQKNRNLDRFFGLLGNGWTCKTFGLTPSLEVCAYLSKEGEESQLGGNVLGIDINTKDFAYTIMTPEGEILKQGYLGQHIWVRKRHFEERRAFLQSLNALKKLKRMRHRQRDYVKTNIGQMVMEIILLAKRYGAGTISIERLSRFRPKGRKFNRKAMTLPFSLFQRILEGRCFDNDITLNRVDPYHTSKWCSRCGAVGAGHDGGNYSLFRCNVCDQIVNSDRKASLAVAVKSLLERSAFPDRNTLQISGRRVPVSGLMRRSSPMHREPLAVSVVAPGRGKPTGFSSG